MMFRRWFGCILAFWSLASVMSDGNFEPLLGDGSDASTWRMLGALWLMWALVVAILVPRQLPVSFGRFGLMLIGLEPSAAPSPP